MNSNESALSKPATACARLMAHELIFSAYLALTLARLLLTPSSQASDCGVFAAMIIGIAAAVYWHWHQPGQFTFRLRLLVFFVAMNLAFMCMETAVPAITPGKADALLRNLDIQLIGETPSILMQSWVRPWLTELMSACYQLFFPYLVIGVFSYAFREAKIARSAFTGLFSLYGLGFLGYTLMPALGPHLAFATDFSTQLNGGAITAYNANLVKEFSTGVDVFPSLHVAVSSYFLLIDRRYMPLRFRILLLPCLGLWFSTFYLRYHYLVDMLAGFALAGFGYWMARLEESRNDLRIKL